MRFEVPQFIEIEDKIVGPLTWRQFIYLAGGIGLLVILYFSLPFVFFAALGLPLGALAFSLAFHRINNRPFSVFLESFLNYTTHGKLYLWKKNTPQTITEAPTRTKLPKTGMPVLNKNSITSLSHKLDLHIPE